MILTKRIKALRLRAVSDAINATSSSQFDFDEQQRTLKKNGCFCRHSNSNIPRIRTLAGQVISTNQPPRGIRNEIVILRKFRPNVILDRV
jgi:hypothetical protein